MWGGLFAGRGCQNCDSCDLGICGIWGEGLRGMRIVGPPAKADGMVGLLLLIQNRERSLQPFENTTPIHLLETVSIL